MGGPGWNERQAYLSPVISERKPVGKPPFKASSRPGSSVLMGLLVQSRAVAGHDKGVCVVRCSSVEVERPSCDCSSSKMWSAKRRNWLAGSCAFLAMSIESREIRSAVDTRARSREGSRLEYGAVEKAGRTEWISHMGSLKLEDGSSSFECERRCKCQGSLLRYEQYVVRLLPLRPPMVT